MDIYWQLINDFKYILSKIKFYLLLNLFINFFKGLSIVFEFYHTLKKIKLLYK